MIARGLLAGTAGVLSLDVFTYGDMLVRGRAASELPSNVAKALADKLGIASLASEDGDAPKDRRSAAGSLLGYGVGLGAAITYAVIRPAVKRRLPWPVAGLVLGAATLVASEGTAAALGVTDPSKWSASDWAMDILPRSVYGLTVASIVEAMLDRATDAAAQPPPLVQLEAETSGLGGVLTGGNGAVSQTYESGTR